MTRVVRVFVSSGMLASFLAVVCPAVCGQGPGVGVPGKSRIAIRAQDVDHDPAKQIKEALLLRQKFTNRDMKAAIRLLEESAGEFQRAGLLVDGARAEREAGDTYLMISNYRSALRTYGRALKLTPADAEQRCSTLSHIARTYATMGASDKASRYSAEAMQGCQRHSAPETMADALEAEGEILFWAGNLNGAIAPLTQAQHLFAEAKDDDGTALALLMLGYANANGNHEEALRLTQDALRLWSSIGDRYGVARAQLALGFFDSTSGQFARAQCDCGAALPIFHEMADKDNEAIAMNILGKVNREMGDLPASLDYYRRAKTDLAGLHDDLAEAEAITGMGQALTALRDYRSLLSLYAEKRRLARRAQNPALLASSLANMAEVYQSEHRYPKAEELYRRALAIYRSAKHPYGPSDMLIRLGFLKSEQGKDAEAISLLESARPLKENADQVEEVAKIQYELAYIYRRMNRLDDARSEIEKNIQIIESQRLRIAKFDSRASYFASVHRYYSLYIQVLMALDEQYPGKGFAQKAFEASEKSKVRSLLDLLTVSEQNSPCDEASGGSLNEAVTRGSNAGEAAAISGTSSVLNLQQIQAAQEGDTLLLEYALGDEASYLWVVERNQIVAYRLPSSDNLREVVKRFLGGLIPPEPRSGETASEYSARIRAANQAYKLYARKLSDLLLGQLTIPAEKRVLVVPDGFLQSIPFAALPLPHQGVKDAVLLTQHEVIVLPSASALGALRMAAAKRPAPTSGIAVLANPIFEPPRAELASSTRKAAAQTSLDQSPVLRRAWRDIQGSQHVPPLPGSREEAMAIQKIFGQQAFMAMGYEANRESVLNGLIAHYRVIHFATHGVIDVRHPEMSGLVLSMVNRQGKPQDGYLRLGDIYKLKLSADLVVLSACESALGKELESEGIIGLPRGFLYAGARSVIASLWKVDDDATTALMQRLYARINQGQTVSAALRGAQLDMAGDRRYSQPNWWAAFVLQGDYNYTIEFKTRL